MASQSDRARSPADARDSPAPMGAPVRMNTAVDLSATVDPRWSGIIDVLVSGLDGTVRWGPDSVVLQLPGHPHDDVAADLEALRLCLGRIRVPVVFDASLVTFPDASLAEFLRKLAESGLMVNVGRVAA